MSRPASLSFLLGFSLTLAASAFAAPAFTIRDVKTITPPGFYNGWPTVGLRSNAQLVVVWSGGREGHVCPFGRVESMVSRDGGENWSWPRVLCDTALDDRDAGVLETRKGTLLVTTFISEAYDAARIRQGLKGEREEKWRRFDQAGRPAELAAVLGPKMLRSTDGGVTWSAPYDVPVNSPHGPFQLANGRLLFAGITAVGKGGYTRPGERIVGVWESADEGATWKLLGRIPPRGKENPEDYHELHGVEAANGRLIVHIRSHAGETADAPNRKTLQTLQTESDDGGRTWSEPHAIGVPGYPSHLRRLRDQRLLMSHTDRRKPFEIQVRVSTDHGGSWSGPMTLTSNTHSGDMGYPSTVELSDGTLLTVWYERTPESPQAVLRQARWTLDAANQRGALP